MKAELIASLLLATKAIELTITDDYDTGEAEGCQGHYFDLEAINDVSISSLEWTFNGCISTHSWVLYTKDGTYYGSEKTPSAWNLACSGTSACNYESGVGWRANTGGACSIDISAGNIKGLYLSGINHGMICDIVRPTSQSYGVSEGDLWTQDNNLKAYVGAPAGGSSLFHDGYPNFIEVPVVSITYNEAAVETPTPTVNPTSTPSVSPTVAGTVSPFFFYVHFYAILISVF